MKIIDSDTLLLPNRQILQDVIQNHPFLPNLEGQVESVQVFLSEHCNMPKECIEIDITNGKVKLGLGHSSKNKSNFIYILYHEFGHVADCLNSKFGYSEQLKLALSDTEKMSVMELWNLSIDARLNVVGLFDLGVPPACYSKKHGWLQSTIHGKLQCHAVMLENQGIPYDKAMKLAEDWWINPSHVCTYEQMITWVKKTSVKGAVQRIDHKVASI